MNFCFGYPKAFVFYFHYPWANFLYCFAQEREQLAGLIFYLGHVDKRFAERPPVALRGVVAGVVAVEPAEVLAAKHIQVDSLPSTGVADLIVALNIAVGVKGTHDVGEFELHYAECCIAR